MHNVLTIIMAGGEGTRLSVLSDRRAKPAVPFGGIFRIIDFSLSNTMHSGGHNVGTLCIMGREPREFSDEDRETLRDLGEMVETELKKGQPKKVAAPPD